MLMLVRSTSIASASITVHSSIYHDQVMILLLFFHSTIPFEDFHFEDSIRFKLHSFAATWHRLGRALLLHSILLFECYWRRLQYYFSQSIGFFDNLVEYWCSYSYLYWVLGYLFLSGISVGVGVATARAKYYGGNQRWCCSFYYIYIYQYRYYLTALLLH